MKTPDLKKRDEDTRSKKRDEDIRSGKRDEDTEKKNEKTVVEDGDGGRRR